MEKHKPLRHQLKFHVCFAYHGNIIKTHLSCINIIVDSMLERSHSNQHLILTISDFIAFIKIYILVICAGCSEAGMGREYSSSISVEQDGSFDS